MFPKLALVWSVIIALAIPAVAQSGDRIRSAMQDSLQRQQAAIRQQLSRQARKQRPAIRNISMTSTRIEHIAMAPSFPRPTPRCAAVPPEELHPQIEQAAAEQGVSSDLLRAVAHAESGFVPCAVSPKGALGMMQIMPATARDLGLVNPWDSQQSLTAGAKYLRQLLDRYNGDVRMALGAYNAGPGRVDRYGDVPPIEETQDYVRRILSEFQPTDTLDSMSAPLPLP